MMKIKTLEHIMDNYEKYGGCATERWVPCIDVAHRLKQIFPTLGGMSTGKGVIHARLQILYKELTTERTKTRAQKED